MPNPLLTAREVAERLNVNVETVYALIARDGLPAIRLGGQWRFEESELRTWLESRRGSGASTASTSRSR